MSLEDVAMKDTLSQTRSESATSDSGAINAPPGNGDEGHDSGSNEEQEEDMVDFEDPEFTLPPSFNQEISEETLCDDECPFVLWATLKISLSEKPSNMADAMFDCLADFVEVVGKEDKHFTVFPYHLSNYKAIANLPQVMVDIDSLPEEIDDWLQYFPQQAKPCYKGGNVYTALLLGLNSPFTTFIKKLILWCKEKKLGL